MARNDCSRRLDGTMMMRWKGGSEMYQKCYQRDTYLIVLFYYRADAFLFVLVTVMLTMTRISVST